MPRTLRASTGACHEHDAERRQRDRRDGDAGFDLLPEVDPAFVEGVAVDEAGDADDGDEDHEDLEAEEGGEAEFLLRLHLYAPEDVDWDCEDWGV